MKKSRVYRSGTRWCFWRWTEVDSGYITRLHILKTPWFAICVHWLHKPDPEPYLHDHPVSFLSIILRGWYTEKRQSGWCQPVNLTHRWFNQIWAADWDRHTIIAVGPGTVTLCLMGPKRREWGFRCGNDWIGWKDYYAAQRGKAAK